MDPMLGSITIIPFTWAPYNFLLCQGQSVAVSQYQAVFSLISTLYGGNTQNFNLPNLQGRAPVGSGQSQWQTNYPIGVPSGVGGRETTTLQASQVPLLSHNHPATFNPTTGSQQVTIPATTGNLGVTANLPVSTAVGTTTGTTSALANGQTGYLAGIKGETSVSDTVSFTGPYTTSTPAAGASATLPATTNVTGTAGTAATSVNITTVNGGTVTVSAAGTPAGASPVSVMQPYLVLNFAIAMNGIYPDRP